MTTSGAPLSGADLWDTVHTQRRALADDLQGLAPNQWEAPSACPGWRVQDVAVHMTVLANMTPGRFFPKFVAAGFSIDRLQQRAIDAKRGTSPAQVLAEFEASIPARSGPPGPKETVLGETVVHAEDIRRPLGMPSSCPPEVAAWVADFYKGSNLVIGTKKRIAGVSLRATDADWAYGGGPEISGPMLPLLLAMTGRAGALTELQGDGVAVLRDRL